MWTGPQVKKLARELEGGVAGAGKARSGGQTAAPDRPSVLQQPMEGPPQGHSGGERTLGSALMRDRETWSGVTQPRAQMQQGEQLRRPRAELGPEFTVPHAPWGQQFTHHPKLAVSDGSKQVGWLPRA